MMRPGPPPRSLPTPLAPLLAALVMLLGAAAPPSLAQHVGDCVSLNARRPDLGIPLHRVAGRNSFGGERIADQAVVRIAARDETSGWFRITTLDLAGAHDVAAGVDRAGRVEREGWIAPAYIGEVVPCPPGGDAPIPPPPGACLIGTWNLEWFKEGATRGFGEYMGDAALPPRTDDDYRAIAAVVSLLDAKVLVLQEINGHTPPPRTSPLDPDPIPRSAELDRLVGHLGPDRYRYIIGATGGGQRLAMLYDTRAVALNWAREASLDNPRINSAQLFARQPLVASFTLFAGGIEMNDVVIVGLHLASGQRNARNHDAAMRAVAEMIEQQRAPGGWIPSNEFDVIICGDLNASRFDGHREAFWTELEASAYDVLADDPGYPSTRLAGVPPGSSTSQIDYIIISAGPYGLRGEEVLVPVATVHTAIVGPDPLLFRASISDHLPVTIPIRIIPDTDPPP